MVGAAKGRLLRKVVSYATSNPMLYLSAAVLGRLGTIILIPLYTKRLTQSEYGGYALAATLLSLLPSLFSLGLGAAITKVFFDAPKGDLAESQRGVGAVARGLISTALALGAVAEVVVVLAVPHGVSLLSQRQLVVVVAGAVCTAIGFIPDLYFRAAQRAKSAITMQLGQLLITATAGILFVGKWHRGLDGAIEAAVSGQLVMALVGMGFALKFRGLDAISTTRRLLLFSITFVPHLLATWLQDMADRWVLSTYGSGKDLGVYYVACQLLSPIPLVIAAWNNAENPKMGEHFRENGNQALLDMLPRELRRYLAAGIVPAILVLSAMPIVPYFVGDRFRDATSLMPFLALGYVIDAVYYPAGNVVFFAGKPWAIPVVTVATALSGLALAFALLRAFGVPGLIAARILTSATRAFSLLFLGRWLVGRVIAAERASA
jgi:O-antigen/teichoic acid export membrane protein